MGKKSKNPAQSGPPRKVITRNRRAFHDYHITDRFEAGLVLHGSEVKSLRDGRVNINDAYGEIREGELYLVAANISEYPQATRDNHEPRRTRKLLMHKAQIRRLAVKLNERGFALVPLELYFVHGRAKIELGLGKGKRQYDKREAVRQRDMSRDQRGEQE